jgi:molybdopterin/thiamine biosynthesis adenylyltransferase
MEVLPSTDFKWQRCTSRIDFSFWQALRNRILHDWKLASGVSKQSVRGFVFQTSTSCVVEVRDVSLTDDPYDSQSVPVHGELVLCNTAHEFKMRDKQALLNETTAEFCLLVYPNIKDNVFLYWFAFPADVLCFETTTVRDCVSWHVIGPCESVDETADLVLPYTIYPVPDSHCYSVPWLARRTLSRFAVSAITSACECVIRDNQGLAVRARFEPVTGGSTRVIGWELDARGAMCPRRADLRAVYDPRHIADSAARLNLELMRWRMLPELDLPRIEHTRCLLLGSGTLGCHIARDLLAWGVRHISFVDAGRVSYTNPVRQPLFEHDDAHKECWKAQAAAEALTRIHPSVVATGHVLRIPMPGHPVHDAERTQVACDVETLQRLIREHDVVFLLTDTRESRWLPTLLARVEHKPALTVALGFDTWLVMRHAEGCYFCLDSVAPKNTTLNRTLDQQCTVTRPGIAPIASATAVELLVALLHHPARFAAPSEKDVDLTASTASPLGVVPHILRGFLSHMQTLMSSATCSKYCTACGEKVVSAYLDGGIDFLLQVFDDETVLETFVDKDIFAELEDDMTI